MIWLLLMVAQPAAEAEEYVPTAQDIVDARVARVNSLVKLQSCVERSLELLADSEDTDLETASYRAMVHCRREGHEFRERSRSSIADAIEAIKYINDNEHAVRVNSLVALGTARDWVFGNPEMTTEAPYEPVAPR